MKRSFVLFVCACVCVLRSCLQSDDGWNPRSLSSFQTFPRHPSPPGSSSSSSTSSSSSSSASSSSSSSSPPSSGPSSPPGLLTNGAGGVASHHHLHSKSLIEGDKWTNKTGLTTNGHAPAAAARPPTHGHSRSLGQATDFSLRDPARRQSSLVNDDDTN